MKALVLSGGGITGIAWELGLLMGLRDLGVDLTKAELIVGTSAGSIVGGLIAAGVTLDEAVADQRQPAGEGEGPTIDMTPVFAAFAVLADTRITPRERRARVGRMALDATTPSEAKYLGRFERLVSDKAWPASPHLVVTGVETSTGDAVQWDHTSGVPLHLAIAASCSLPGVFPPVTIGDKRYIDGGIRSPTNADLAAGASSVVVLAPLGLAFAPRWSKEREALGEARVTFLAPDDIATAAIGQSFMDPSRRSAAAEAGLAQAARVLDDVKHGSA